MTNDYSIVSIFFSHRKGKLALGLAKVGKMPTNGDILFCSHIH